jgi:hypothetical protein
MVANKPPSIITSKIKKKLDEKALVSQGDQARKFAKGAPDLEFWRSFHAQNGKEVDMADYAKKVGVYNQGKSHWQNPLNIAQAYNQIQAAPPGTVHPDMPVDQITAAYKYLQEQNGDLPWYMWKPTIDDDDPINEVLAGMSVPGVSSGRFQGETLDQTAARLSGQQQAQVTPASPPSLARNPAFNYQLTDKDRADAKTLGFTDEQMLDFRYKQWNLVNNPLDAGKVLEGATAKDTLAGNVMRLLDYPYRFIEHIIGTVGQEIDWIGDKSIEEMIAGLPDAWNASEFTYEGLGVQVTRAAAGLTDEQIDLMARSYGNSQEWHDAAMRVRDEQIATPAPTMDVVYSDALASMKAGKTMEEIQAELVVKYPGALATELLGAVVLDPLNIAGTIVKAPIGIYAKATGNKALRMAVEGSSGPLEAAKIYARTARSGMKTEEAMSEANSLVRWLADVDEAGKLKMLNPELAKNSSFLGRLFHLTPTARANEMLAISYDNLRTMVFDAGIADVESAVAIVKTLAKGDIEEISKLTLANPWIASPEGGALKMALQGYDAQYVDDLVKVWYESRGNASILAKMEDALGLEKDGEIVRLLAKGKGQNLLDSFKAKLVEAGDPKSLELLASLNDVNKPMTAAELEKIGNSFIGGGLPYALDDFKAMLTSGAAEHMDTFVTKWFGVKPDSTILRFSHLIKSGQSLALLGFNPSYALQNGINNITTMVWDGIMGLYSPAKSAKFWKSNYGYYPTKLEEAFGGAANISGDFITGQSDFGKAIREASSVDKGAIAGAQKAVSSKAVKKWTLATRASTWMERQSSRIAMTVGTDKALAKFWKPGLGYDVMPKALKEYLNNSSPKLGDMIEVAIASNTNPKEMLDAIYDGVAHKTIDVAVPEVAAKLGMTQDAVIDTLKTTGVYDLLKTKLTKAGNDIKDIRGAFRDVRENIQSKLDDMVNAQSEMMARNVSGRVKSEGAQAALNAFDDLVVDRTAFWHNHFEDMDKVFAHADTLKRDAAGALHRAQDAIEQREWARLRNVETAQMRGIFDGLGANDAQKGILSNNLQSSQAVWGGFYQERRRILDNFFDRAYAKEVTSAQRSEMWKVAQAEIDGFYDAANKAENALQLEIDNAFADLLEKQFSGSRKSAMAWRDGVRKVNEERVSMLKKFRKDLGEISFEDRRAKQTEFYQGEYARKINELREANLKRINDMYSGAVTGANKAPRAQVVGRVTITDLHKAVGITEDEWKLGWKQLNKYIEPGDPPFTLNDWYTTPTQEKIDRMVKAVEKRGKDTGKVVEAPPVAPVAEAVTPPVAEVATPPAEGVKLTLANIQDQSVRDLGFTAKQHALNSVNKRLGKQYKTLEEVPWSEVEEAGKLRKVKEPWEMTKVEFEKSPNAYDNGRIGYVSIGDLPTSKIRPGGSGEKAVLEYMDVLRGKGNADLASRIDRKTSYRLRDAITKGGELPITVDFEGRKINVVDGQHRLEAYRRLGYDKVPVEYTNTYFGYPDSTEGWKTLHQSLIEKAISEGKTIPPEVLKDYPDLLPPTIAPKVEEAIAQIKAEQNLTSKYAKLGGDTVDLEAWRIRDTFKEDLLKTGRPAEEVEASMALMDAHAAVWAEKNGKNVNDWWSDHIAGFGEPGEGALYRGQRLEQFDKLVIEIDEQARKADVAKVLNSDWYANLKKKIAAMDADEDIPWTPKATTTRTTPYTDAVNDATAAVARGEYPSVSEALAQNEAWQSFKGEVGRTRQEFLEQRGGKQPWEMTKEEYLAKYPYPETGAYYKMGGDYTEKSAVIELKKNKDWASKGYTVRPSRDHSGRFIIARTKTTEEYARDVAEHHRVNVVMEAISEGKPVPAEVLAGYPDLAKLAKVTPPTTPGVLRGAITFDPADGRALFKVFESANASTIPHELGHLFRRDLDDAQLLTVKNWLGDAGIKVDLSNGKFIGDQAVEAEEHFARGWERYLREGYAPTEGLKKVFEQFKTWLKQVYKSVKGSDIDVPISKEMRELFDGMLAEKPIKNIPMSDVRNGYALVENRYGTAFQSDYAKYYDARAGTGGFTAEEWSEFNNPVLVRVKEEVARAEPVGKLTADDVKYYDKGSRTPFYNPEAIVETRRFDTLPAFIRQRIAEEARTLRDTMGDFVQKKYARSREVGEGYITPGSAHGGWYSAWIEGKNVNVRDVEKWLEKLEGNQGDLVLRDAAGIVIPQDPGRSMHAKDLLRMTLANAMENDPKIAFALGNKEKAVAKYSAMLDETGAIEFGSVFGEYSDEASAVWVNHLENMDVPNWSPGSDADLLFQMGKPTNKKAKMQQAGLFTSEDLPLFSGTPQNVTGEVFKPKPVERQETLFNTWDYTQTKKKLDAGEAVGLDEAAGDTNTLFQRSKKDVTDEAIEYFGLTTNTKEAGYILPDGRMLDLSGKAQGGEVGVRSLDHREVNFVGEINGIRDFATQTGSMRISDLGSILLVDVYAMPTPEQILAIKRMVRGGKDVNWEVAARGEFGYALREELTAATPKDIDRLFAQTEEAINSNRTFYQAGDPLRVVKVEGMTYGNMEIVGKVMDGDEVIAYVPESFASSAWQDGAEGRFRIVGIDAKDDTKFVVQYEGGELKKLASADIGTPEFKTWNKGNKLVKNGKPIVLFHGTPNGGFTEFKKFPAYFSDKKEVADIYRSSSASSLTPNKVTTRPETYTVYGRMKKPFDTRLPEVRDLFEREFVGQGGENWSDMYMSGLSERGLPDWVNGNDIYEFIREKGYDFDGIILDEGGLAGLNEGEVFDRGLSYLLFEPEQVKSVYNLAPTEKPDILFQRIPIDGEAPVAINAPLGSVDQLDPNPPITQAMNQGWNDYIKPIMDELESNLTASDAKFTGSKLKGMNLPPEVKKQLDVYLSSVQGQLKSTKQAARTVGGMKRDMSLLNYTKRYGFDGYLEAIFPYQFWMTRSMMNWGQRFIDKPWIMSKYSQIRKFQAQMEEGRDGFPTRLKNKMGIAMPFLPEGWGGGVFIDPLKQIFPFSTFGRPLEALSNDENLLQKSATSIIREWQAEESISPQEGQQAIADQSGALWERAMVEAQKQTDVQVENPVDLMSQMSSMSLPLQTFYNAVSGHPENIGKLPVTKTIQSMTSLLGINQGKGIDIEAFPRDVLGLPSGDKWEDYRVDRELSNMAANGEITAEDAQMAMIDRQGEAFDMAAGRVQQQQSVRTMTSYLLLDFFPEGEYKQRKLGEKFNAAYDAFEAGDTKALQTFFDKYPEYEARLAAMKDPKERMRQFVISNIWDKYMGMGKAEQKAIREQFGDNFNNLFLNKDTRAYDTLSTETLTYWASSLGGTTPETAGKVPASTLKLPDETTSTAVNEYYRQKAEQFPGLDSIYAQMEGKSQLEVDQISKQYQDYLNEYSRWRSQYLAANPSAIEMTQSEMSELYGMPVQLQQTVYQYRAERDSNFPEWLKQQNAYFAISTSSGRRSYIQNHPELQEFWDFKNYYAASNPQAAPYILSDESLSTKIMGGNKEWRITEHPPVLTQGEQAQMTPELLRQVNAYFVTGTPLSYGAIMQLREIWEGAGQPGGDLDTYLRMYVRQYVAANQ